MTPSSSRKITRTRPSLNCLPCRTRKVKCGRESGSCGACVKLGIACEYGGENERQSVDAVAGNSEHTPAVNVSEDGTDDGTSGRRMEASVEPRRYKPAKRSRSTSSLGDQEAGARGSFHRTPAFGEADIDTTAVADRAHAERSSTTAYLSTRSDHRIRYVDHSFWGFVAGQEPLCETALGHQASPSQGTPPPHINVAALTLSLRFLPQKAVADILLQSFILRIHPIHPLVHLPSFRAQHDAFWEWRTANPAVVLSDNLHRDPTVVCLLFAVLYSGAAAATTDLFRGTLLQGLDKSALVDQLMVGFAASQKACQHETHPTLNTLTGALLAWPCLHSSSDAAAEAEFVGSAVRVARGLGLHCGVLPLGLGGLEGELRQRVWRHVVCLDVENTMLHGCALFCAAEDVLRRPVMEVEVAEGKMGGESVDELLATARYEVARFHHELAATSRQSSHNGTQTCDAPSELAAKLSATIDTLTARLPASSDPAAASLVQYTHLALDTLKAEAEITLHKHLLAHAPTSARKSWHA